MRTVVLVQGDGLGGAAVAMTDQPSTASHPMSAITHATAFLCVVAIAAGQVLFKFTALALAEAGTPLNGRVILFGAAALGIYGLATLAWIALLQNAALGKVYPYMALSFVFVPAAGVLLFGETLSLGQLAGTALVLAGVAVVAFTS